MNTKLSLKNFRVFNTTEGGTFNLAPITILTGRNSSGKSSLVKAILLLNHFINDLLSHKVHNCKLNFGLKAAKLGGFDLARNKFSKSTGKIYFSYTTTPRKLRTEVLVELWFASNDNDKLNNGWLDRFVIRRNSDKRVIMDASYAHPAPTEENRDVTLHIHKADLNIILSNFYKYVGMDLLSSEAGFTQITRDADAKDALKEVNLLADAFSRYISYEEAFEVVNRYLGTLLGESSEYSAQLYIDAMEQGVVHPLPIIALLKGVQKQKVRDTIYTAINSVGNGSKFYFKPLLDDVITAFEESDYADFVTYYKAKEREGIVFRDLHTSYGDICFASYSVSDEFANSIDSYSCLLNIPLLNEMPYEEGNDPSKFAFIYYAMAELSKYINPNKFEQAISRHWPSDFAYYDEHRIYTDLRKFFDSVVSDALSPVEFKNFLYVGDADIEVKRIYALESKDAMGELLAKYFEVCRIHRRNFKPGMFINKWIKAFGIGERVSIELSADGYGILIRLYKDEKDRYGTLLVDEGYGVTKFIATLINIEYAILTAPSRGEQGYITVAIEEPENHLHPKFQSLLADMFMDAYKKFGIQFIVETHSEYLIRKLQTLVAKKQLSQDEVSLQYVYDAQKGKRPEGEPHVKSIQIREDGTLKDAFGPGFFDEADNLAMDLLTIKALG